MPQLASHPLRKPTSNAKSNSHSSRLPVPPFTFDFGHFYNRHCSYCLSVFQSLTGFAWFCLPIGLLAASLGWQKCSELQFGNTHSCRCISWAVHSLEAACVRDHGCHSTSPNHVDSSNPSNSFTWRCIRQTHSTIRSNKAACHLPAISIHSRTYSSKQTISSHSIKSVVRTVTVPALYT